VPATVFAPRSSNHLLFVRRRSGSPGTCDLTKHPPAVPARFCTNLRAEDDSSISGSPPTLWPPVRTWQRLFFSLMLCCFTRLGPPFPKSNSRCTSALDSFFRHLFFFFEFPFHRHDVCFFFLCHLHFAHSFFMESRPRADPFSLPGLRLSS